MLWRKTIPQYQQVLDIIADDLARIYREHGPHDALEAASAASRLVRDWEKRLSELAVGEDQDE